MGIRIAHPYRAPCEPGWNRINQVQTARSAVTVAYKGPEMETGDETADAVWRQAGVACVVVPGAEGYDVELRNAHGVPFLRKNAGTNEAAHNEAEYLRLLLESDHLPAGSATLKPFAIVVEDDQESSEAFADALKSIGIRALGVNRGVEALRLARALAPDLIVVDSRLPDITGTEICRRLRDDPELAPVPIIALTSLPDAMRADGCVADAILTRPCRLETFLAASRLFLRPARADHR
jgi:two-component system cell cycle response regulator DivK